MTVHLYAAIVREGQTAPRFGPDTDCEVVSGSYELGALTDVCLSDLPLRAAEAEHGLRTGVCLSLQREMRRGS